MPHNNAVNAIKKCDKAVLVIGDIMLDRYVLGATHRLSPEAPVPVLLAEQEQSVLGGAANVIANVSGLYVPCYAMGVVGCDAHGEQVRAMLQAIGCDVSGIISADDRPTITKTRFMAAANHLLRLDHEVIKPLSDQQQNYLLQQLKSVLDKISLIVLSDYAKGVLVGDMPQRIIAMAKAANTPVIVDPKGNDYTRYKGATLVTPNKKELSDAAKGYAQDDNGIVQAAQHLMKECGIENMLVTRSEEGMTLIEKTSSAQSYNVQHIRSHKIDVHDVSGAGDTVIAVMAAAIAGGASLQQAAELANHAGGIVVTRIGTSPILLQDLDPATPVKEPVKESVAVKQSSLVQLKTASLQAPFMDLESAANQVQQWQAQGLKVGLTNGCFDILHAGHVNYMNTARQTCDKLVVAINTDQSVRLLKGPSRPVNNQYSRATVLGGLASIDLVVPFGAENIGEDNTASPIVRALKPDLYYKGADYTIDRIPEAAIVQSYGGQVALIDLTEGHSTTNIIRKISES